MFATRPTRYVVEWDDADTFEQLKADAIECGDYSEDHDDWFEPHELVAHEDATTLKEARRLAKMHARTAHYGEARILERVGIVEVGAFWDFDGTKEVETVQA